MESAKKLGIYIDVSNVEFSLEEYNSLGLYFDYSKFIRLMSEGYDLKVLCGYNCPVRPGSPQAAVHSELENAGVEMKLYRPQVETDDTGKRIVRQKEVDSSIVVDVSWDLAKGIIDEAVIVSGDRDMYPAVERAAENGFTVRIAAVESSISDDYRSVLNGCILIDDCEAFLVRGDFKEDRGYNIATFRLKEEVKADE